MQNVIALLSGARQTRTIDAIAVLDEAIKTGSIYNVKLVDAKDAMGRALNEVKEIWQKQYLATPEAQTNDFEQDIYYWHAVLTNLPGLHKKAVKFSDRPLVASFIALTAEFLPYAEAIKGKKFEVIKGRVPSNEPPKPVDESNTGICAICGKRHKLTKAGKLVDHGYQISDGNGYIGFRSGSCFGVDFRPFEISTEANVAYDKAIDGWIVKENEILDNLRTGKVTSFTVEDNQRNEAGRWVKVDVKVTAETDARRFAKLLAANIRKHEGEIVTLKAIKADNQTKIDNWKAQPLAA